MDIDGAHLTCIPIESAVPPVDKPFHPNLTMHESSTSALSLYDVLQSLQMIASSVENAVKSIEEVKTDITQLKDRMSLVEVVLSAGQNESVCHHGTSTNNLAPNNDAPTEAKEGVKRKTPDENDNDDVRDEDPNVVMTISDDDDESEPKKVCLTVPDSPTINEYLIVEKPPLPSSWTQGIASKTKKSPQLRATETSNKNSETTQVKAIMHLVIVKIDVVKVIAH